jgi:acetyl esterase/lipase
MTLVPHPMPHDPEILEFIARSESFFPPGRTGRLPAENRAHYEALAIAMRGHTPQNVSWTDFAIAAENPRRAIASRRYRRDAAPYGAIVLYLHGGGFTLGGLESHHDVCLGLCNEAGAEIAAVEYRLAPEYPHPAQSEDCEAAFLALSEEDRPVILAGDSAGANLVAGLALRIRDRGYPVPAGQILIYPDLGGDHDAGSFIENADAPLLTRADCLAYAATRTGGRAQRVDRDADLAPLTVPSFLGLPPAFVVSADIDPLRDDARDYAEKLRAAGVRAEWRNEPELVHGYLRARHTSRRAAQSFAAIASAIRAFAEAAEG